ncbi:MAG: DNA polymerase III subunit gamma/tau [Clostridiales bacterium]|nr:MAG: DNA polymerase III subunit gamma/tau [Clostridiales bacterium]
MAYLSLYRRLRPQRFDAVVGQDSTIATLTNQIESGRLAHAYLFTGSHGTGKTSTAKILARAVNCEQRDGVNPCNNCPTCRSILNDANIDVIEMDAASNNGVDDIRELREIVKFPPSSCNYKVMIIDEVHMLSKGAFNALLKTLEEPPQYIIFVLATTEPHKVPTTISSRCQHFAFKRFEDDVMLANLRDNCQSLNINAADEALELIVKLAAGAMRDAQSLLEQSIAYGGSELTYQVVSDALGCTADQSIQHLADCIIARDQLAIVNTLAEHYRTGKDSAVLIDALIDLFRNGMLTALSGDVDSAAPNQRQWLKTVVDKLTAYRWQTILNKLLALAQSIKYQSHDHLALELGLLELCNMQQTDDNTALAARLAELEATVQTLLQKNTLPKTSFLDKPERVPADNIVTDLAEQLPQNDITFSIEDNSQQRITEAQFDVTAEPVTTSNLTGSPDLATIKAQWPSLMSEIKNILPTTFALMKKVEPIDYDGTKLVLKIDDTVKVLRLTILQDNHIANIKQAFHKIFNSAVAINVVEDAIEDRESALRAYFKGVAADADIIIK